MSKYLIGSTFASLVIGIALRFFVELASIPLPFSLGWIDFCIVIFTASSLGLSVYSLVLKKYPDTKEMLPLFSVIVCVFQRR